MTITALLLCLSLTACGGQGQTGTDNSTQTAPAASAEQAADTGVVTSADELAFPLGQKVDSPSFTGDVYITSMITPDDTYNFPATNHIIFAPGARSSWQSHGGSKDSRFAHIAVNTNPDKPGVEWFDRITSEEYDQIAEQE